MGRLWWCLLVVCLSSMVLLVCSYYAGLCVFLVTALIVWWISLIAGSGVLFVCVDFRLCLVYLISLVLLVWCGFGCLWSDLIFNWFVGDSDCLYLVGGAVLWCLPELSLWCVINSVVH